MNRTRNFFAAVSAMLIVALLAIPACGPSKPACSPETLESIEANYVAEMQAKCKGYTRATCPATEEVETRYRDQRQEWISCH